MKPVVLRGRSARATRGDRKPGRSSARPRSSLEAKRPLGLLCALHVATLAAARPVLAEPAGQSARRAATANDTGHAPSEEHDVVVRGKRRPASAGPKDRAVAGSVVQRKRLSAAGSRAADALREVAGVQVTDTGGVAAPATASLRGATASETPVYLAGVRLNDDVAGTADLGTIPLFLVDRIEVYRGHAPIEADRLGLGGAIFFEPRRPETIGSGAALFGGSYGTRGGSVHVSAGGERHATVLGMRREVARNDYLFDNDSGTLLIDAPARTERRRNAEAALSDLWVLHRSRPGDARTDVLIHRVTREQGAPKLATVPATAARAGYERTLGAVVARAPLGGDDAVEAQTSAVVARSLLDDPLFELALSTSRTESLGDRVAQRVAARLRLTERLSLRPAVDASVERLRRFERRGSEKSLEPALVATRRTVRAAAALQLEVLSALSMRALGAVECTETRASTLPDGQSDCVPGGRAGPLVDLGNAELYCNVGRYHRAPTLGELYGMSFAVHGNPRLAPEQGWVAEAGARWVGQSARWAATANEAGQSARRAATADETGSRLESGEVQSSLDIALFSRWATDLVSFVRSAQGFISPVNRGAGRVLGVEIEAEIALARWLAGGLGITLLDPRDTTPGRTTTNAVLPFVSRWVAASGLRAILVDSPVGPARRIELEGRYLYQSSRYADAAGLAVIPAQSSVDLELAVTAFDTALTASARAANVLDSRRFDTVGFPLPGRSFFISTEVTW